ncbi:MAG: ABC transporter permease [Euryarchaeota archaeon]|nr:ABC transporter permease [Euryarchaeota archaeon]
MSLRKHLNILDYAARFMLRRKGKNLATLLVFTLVVFMLASVVMMMGSLKKEAEETLALAPDITVQKIVAGRQGLVPLSYAARIEEIRGVSRVEPRVWGYYYDAVEDATYTILGVESLPFAVVEGSPPGEGEVAVGYAIAEKKRIRPGDRIILRDYRGNYVKFTVAGVFSSSSSLQSADIIAMPRATAREFFGIPPEVANDLAVYVANPAELTNIAYKISLALPDARVLTRAQIRETYDAIFGWRSGIFLASIIGALLAFAILVWDRASGLSAEEKREIGILKALGWSTGDVLEMRTYEGVLLALNSYLLGIILAYLHVYQLGAPLLKPVLLGWSTLYPSFELMPALSVEDLLLIFMVSVVPFLAAVVVPSWRASTVDPDEAMRGI